MTFTIITPTYNSEKTIDRNIKSVLSQTVKDFEHIIIDNLSSDQTLKIIKSLYIEAGLEKNLKIISEKDSGITDAFNKGIKAAAGEIITILNSDDYYYNDRVFERVLHAMKAPDVMYTHGDMYFNDPVFGSNVRKPLLCSVTEAMPFNHPTMFLRRSLYEEYGVFDPSFIFVMDYELFIRYEKLIKNFRLKGKYLKGEPVAVMSSGGASWKNELETVKESRRALKMHGFWNFNARKNYLLRILRISVKKYLNIMNLNVIVRLWRKGKWG